jgi:hypothetical protein
MAAANESSFDWSRFFLVFFFICFILVMLIGMFAIFTYNVNAPQPAPGGPAHGGMIFPLTDIRQLA